MAAATTNPKGSSMASGLNMASGLSMASGLKCLDKNGLDGCVQVSLAYDADEKSLGAKELPLKIFVLDQSGSMSVGHRNQTPWDTILNIVNKIEETKRTKHIYLLYAAQCARATVDEIRKTIADGATDFVMMLLSLQHEITATTNREVVVTIMTDGCDTVNGKPDIAAAVTEFKDTLLKIDKTKKQVTIHTIGFTPGFLLRLPPLTDFVLLWENKILSKSKISCVASPQDMSIEAATYPTDTRFATHTPTPPSANHSTDSPKNHHPLPPSNPFSTHFFLASIISSAKFLFKIFKRNNKEY
jgi:hypothetical protein